VYCLVLSPILYNALYVFLFFVLMITNIELTILSTSQIVTNFACLLDRCPFAANEGLMAQYVFNCKRIAAPHQML